ncbi:hypothetical protein TNCV_267221 [Trichonephila clavipes]|nr:hypothetical protein TNCV_267221 [Trichonephila clavipes]
MAQLSPTKTIRTKVVGSPRIEPVHGLSNARFTVWVPGAVDLRENTAECSPSGCTSCLGKRSQILECRRLERSSME